jgi:malate dehydrogenase (oxaloacetate-decarboxylating)
MFTAAASAVSSLVSIHQQGGSLLPHIDDLRAVSRTVAGAVAEAAEAEGLARVQMNDIAKQVEAAMWQPRYKRIVAA